MQAKKWRFLDTGKGSAFFNMALDEVMLGAIGRGESPPAFRVYEWDPAAVTVGYSQSIGDAVDLARCTADRIDVAKRPTGGREVYHDDEIAYSVIASQDDQYFGGTLAETYRSVSRVLCDALNRIGVDAEIARGTGERGRPARRNAPCFGSTSRFEIVVGGKKLVGSAQRRIGELFLQQGSILTGPGQERIALYLKDGGDARLIRERLQRKSVHLRLVLGDSFSRGSLVDALRESLEKAVGGSIVSGPPSREETEAAVTLAAVRSGVKGQVAT